MAADSVRFAALGLSPLTGRDDLRSVRARRRQTGRRLPPSACCDLRRRCRSDTPPRIDSWPSPAASCVGRALRCSMRPVAVQSRVTRLARANPCAAAPASRQRPGPPVMKLGTAAAASTVVARSGSRTRWQMQLTGRALASDLESTPNEAADVPAAVSRSSTACPASGVLLQPGTTTPSGRALEKSVSRQAPHAHRSALMAQCSALMAR